MKPLTLTSLDNTKPPPRQNWLPPASRPPRGSSDRGPQRRMLQSPKPLRMLKALDPKLTEAPHARTISSSTRWCETWKRRCYCARKNQTCTSFGSETCWAAADDGDSRTWRCRRKPTRFFVALDCICVWLPVVGLPRAKVTMGLLTLAMHTFASFCCRHSRLDHQK